MGEEVRGVPEAAAVAPLASETPVETGIGRYLAAQRRLRGVTLEELAHLTKIPSRSLQRLESGAFDSSRDGFVRGFVRTVAEALGLDPDEAVMRLLEEPRADPAGAGARRPGLQRQLPLVPLAALAAVLLAALLVWQVVSYWMTPSAEPETREVLMRRDPVRELALEARAAAEAAPPRPALEVPATAPDPAAPAEPDPFPEAAPEATSAATPAAPAPPAATPAAPAPPAATPAAPAPPAATPAAPATLASPPAAIPEAEVPLAPASSAPAAAIPPAVAPSE